MINNYEKKIVVICKTTKIVDIVFFCEHNHLVAIMCTLFAAGRMFLPGTPEFCTNTTYQDDIAALNTT